MEVNAYSWYHNTFKEKVEKKTGKGIDWAFLDGVEVTYQVDPLVRVCARAGMMRAESGSMEMVTSGTGASHIDTWNMATDLVMLSGGAGFTLPFAERSRAVVNLFLGTGLAEVYIYHRELWKQTTGDSFRSAFARGRGTGFFPEFALDVEHDVSDSVSAGIRAAYRFGAVNMFRHRTSSSVNFITDDCEASGGETIRDGKGDILSIDYGGAALTVLLSIGI